MALQRCQWPAEEDHYTTVEYGGRWWRWRAAGQCEYGRLPLVLTKEVAPHHAHQMHLNGVEDGKDASAGRVN